MKELLVVLLVSPVILLAVVNEQLQTWQPAAAAKPVIVRQQVAVPTPALAPTVVPKITAGGNLLDIAKQWLGVPYSWGGCTPKGTDCSCFVQNVLRAVGINVPRTTTAQFAGGVAVTEPQLGDLVFFNDTCTGCGPNPTHVGLAIGGGLMIHCGDPCQVASIASFGSKYAGARRWQS